MLLGLSKIVDCPGASIPFSVSLDLSDLCFGVCCPAKEPVQASGQVRNTAGVLVMTGAVTARLDGVCDRCASAFSRDVTYPIRAVLASEPAEEENDEEWIFPLVKDCADLEEIVRTVFVLNMEPQLLCRPDCRGMCYRCGKNLNDGPCDCKKELDPRFAALRQLLDP